jgi:hypothetical protein
VRGFIVGMQPAMTSWAPTDWNKKKGGEEEWEPGGEFLL